MFNQKSLAKSLQANQIKTFKLGQKTSLHVAAISKVPGVLYSNKIHQYTKEEVSLSNAGAVHFIQKDNESEGFVWHAPEPALKQALRYGLIPVEAPTAKAIAALGIYKQHILTRAYEKGIISNKYQQKEALVTLAQDNLTALQGLERLVNTFNANADLCAEKTRIDAVINETLKAINQLKINSGNTLASLTEYDKAAIAKIENFYNAQINSLRQLQSGIQTANANQLRKMLKPTGVNSLLVMVKTESIAILVKIQELNQNITYSRQARAFMRGDLNNAIEDALKVLRDYDADPHNPILAEHQGYYLQDPTTNTIAIDFSHLSNNETKTNQTLRAIIEISGEGIQVVDKKEGYRLNNQPLKTTRFTKWTTNAKFGFMPKRITTAIINIITGAIVGLVFDLPFGFLTSLFSLGQYKMPSLASKLSMSLDTGAPKNTHASELIKRLSFKNLSAGVILGQKLSSFIRDTVLDVGRGIWQSTKNFQFKGFDELISDFKTGAWESYNNHEDELAEALSKLKILTHTKTAFERRITEKEAILINQHKKTPLHHTHPITCTSSAIALPPYSLNSGEWDDISNASIHGAISVSETFIHNIHAKHPFVGLIFSTTYVLGGLTVLAPGLLSYLSQYTAFSQIVGNLMAQGTNSAAIASGFTQAKILAALFEAIMHGGDSWIATGAKQFEKNPANTLVYTALAVGLGYGLANYAHIPGLSAYIQEDTGNVPEIGWAFAGGKIGFLLMELLESKEKEEQSNKNFLITELKQELYKIIPNATQEEIENFSAELLQHTHQFIRRLTFLHCLEENKALLPDLDNKTKRNLLFISRELFKTLDSRSARLRSMKETLYPQLGKSIFARTITLITDYIPLLTRCLLSPLSASLQPWGDLNDKVIKDTARIAHGLGKLINATLKTFIRLFFRGVADVLTNEIPARLEGFIRNNKHRISAQTYAITTCYEKSAEAMRQFASSASGVDSLCQAATAPAIEAVLKQTQQQTMTQVQSHGFFKHLTTKPKPNPEPEAEPETPANRVKTAVLT